MLVNRYVVYGADANGAKTATLWSLAQQKRLAFKEKVRFYGDQEKTNEIYSFRAEKVIDIHGRFFVEGPQGELIGMFKKKFTESLAVSTWVMQDISGNERFIIRESNLAVALLRRYIGWLPFIGEIAELVMLFFKYHFEFIDVATGAKVGKYYKVTLFRDQYVLEMTDDAFNSTDWRTLVSMGVALDALQSR